MTIEKNKLQIILEVVALSTGITFSQARIRDAFIKQLNEHAVAFNQDRVKIAEKLSVQKNGKAVTIKENGVESYNIKDPEKFNKEYEILSKETVTITCDKDAIYKIIEKTKYEPKFGEVEIIDGVFGK